MTTMSVAATSSDGQVAGVVPLLPFEEIYRSHAGSVHRFCVSQVPDAGAAEDLTHHTFVRAFVAYGRVGPDLASARAWLLAIARNLCADHHRRGARWRRVAPRLAEPSPGPGDVEAAAERRGDLRRVTAALARFRERDRQLIGLRVAADLSYREIAEVLGTTEAVAKVATQRGRGRGPQPAVGQRRQPGLAGRRRRHHLDVRPRRGDDPGGEGHPDLDQRPSRGGDLRTLPLTGERGGPAGSPHLSRLLSGWLSRFSVTDG
jgi:RNA polymerase sigma-70 factor (ECF subfamily)